MGPGQFVHPFWSDSYGESEERLEPIVYDCGKTYTNLDAWSTEYSKELETFLDNQIDQITKTNENLNTTFDTVIKQCVDEYKEVSDEKYQIVVKELVSDIHRKDFTKPVWHEKSIDPLPVQ